MRNKWHPQTEFFICDCESIEHQVVMQIWEWNKDESIDAIKEWGTAEEQIDVSIHVTLPVWMNFFQRCWAAIKYIFGYECKYGHFDVVNITYDDSERMIKVLQNYRDKVNEYRVKLGETKERT